MVLRSNCGSRSPDVQQHEEGHHIIRSETPKAAFTPNNSRRISLGTLKQTSVNNLFCQPQFSSEMDMKEVHRLQNENFRTKCIMLSNEVSRKTTEIEALRGLLFAEKEKNEQFEQVRVKLEISEEEVKRLLAILSEKEKYWSQLEEREAKMQNYGLEQVQKQFEARVQEMKDYYSAECKEITSKLNKSKAQIEELQTKFVEKDKEVQNLLSKNEDLRQKEQVQRNEVQHFRATSQDDKLRMSMLVQENKEMLRLKEVNQELKQKLLQNQQELCKVERINSNIEKTFQKEKEELEKDLTLVVKTERKKHKDDLMKIQEQLNQKLAAYQHKFERHIHKTKKSFDRRFSILSKCEKKLSVMVTKLANVRLKERDSQNLKELKKQKKALKSDIKALLRRKKFAEKYEVFL